MSIHAGYFPVPYASLQDLCARIFASYGFSIEQSEEITQVLLSADLWGIESHGVQRLVRYDKEIMDGWVDPRAVPEVAFETPLSAVIDAHHAMGQLVSREAMNLAIQKAKDHGAGFVTVRNSNHYGIAGYYARMAAEAGMIGLCMTNSEAIMVPTYGRQAMLGTNPIAMAMPADPVPFLFDAATSVVTRGKLEVYRKRGEPLPQGWALDAEGRESTDPDQVLDNIIAKRGGGILPVGGSDEIGGGHKGYGFGMICEIFTGILSGGRTSNHVNTTPGHTHTAHGFIAISPSLFGDPLEIRDRFSRFLQEMRDAQKAVGQERIYIQGEKEVESTREKMKSGIPINEKTRAEINRIASARGVQGAV